MKPLYGPAFAVILVVLCGSYAPQLFACHLANSICGVFNSGPPNPLPYHLFLPPGHDDPVNKFPLVVSLHGVDERGTDNRAQLNRIGALIDATQSPEFASFLLAPQTPRCCHSWQEDQSDLTVSLIQEVMAEYSIDPSRIYVTGFSDGGAGTNVLLLNEPNMFAAAVPIAGRWRELDDPQFQEDARRISHIPIWMIHGDQDEVVPILYDRAMYQALIAAGGSPRFTEIPGAGHFIVPGVYEEGHAELYPWLFSQRASDRVPEPNACQLITLAMFTLSGFIGRAVRHPTRSGRGWRT